MKKFSIYFLPFLVFNSALYSMENKKSADFSTKESCINRLPFELIQKICLLSEGCQTNMYNMICRFLKLRINKEWQNTLQQEIFWKNVFANLFENIIHEYGLLELEQEIAKYKKLDNKIAQRLQIREQTSEIYITIKKCLNEILNDEQFWKIAFYNFFKNFMANHKHNELQKKILEWKKTLEDIDKVAVKLKDDAKTFNIWLKFVSIFAATLEDVKCSYAIRDAIYNLKLEEAKKLITIAKATNEYKFWHFNSLQSAIEALDRKNYRNLKSWEFDRKLVVGFIRYLIEEVDIKIDAKGYKGYTALMLASSFGLIDIIDVLMQYNADINEKSVIGSQPIMFAAQGGHMEATEKLISYGANIFAKGATIYGSALGFAIKWKEPLMVEKLLNYGVDTNEKFKNNWTALMIAAEGGHDEIAKMLIANGANINAQNDFGFTPLMFACKNKRFQIIKILLDANADANIRNKENQTAVEILSGLIQTYTEIEQKKQDQENRCNKDLWDLPKLRK